MADSRFFLRATPLQLEEIVSITHASLLLPGDSYCAQLIEDVAPLDRAGKSDISFLDNVKYVDTFVASSAGACFVREKFVKKAPTGMALLITEDPYRCFALIAQRIYPAHVSSGLVSPSAFIASSAQIGANCSVGAGAVIEENAEICEGTSICSGAVIHKGVKIGKNSHIGSNSTLSHCMIGNNVIIHSGVHIGQDGFGFSLGRDGHIKVPQLGRVIIEDDVEIGSGTCIDRGTGPDTIIGAGTKIDNLVQIGHNVHIGRNCIIVAHVGISGSTKIGDGVMLGGQCGIAGHLKIGSGVRVVAQSGVIHDIPAGETYGGSPAIMVKDWHRQTIALARLATKRGGKDDGEQS
jgi:UDP-3-O-[3-hydroxymyristoyl] glucosamine N-acyltransferase